MDQTKYYIFHRSPGHTTNDYTTWTKYFKMVMKEGKCNKYVDRLTGQPRREIDANVKPIAKTIQINKIFVESEHLGATNSSKKKKI
ncbi:hypothetical protein ACFX2C_047001 [Malus domestica]